MWSVSYSKTSKREKVVCKNPFPFFSVHSSDLLVLLLHLNYIHLFWALQLALQKEKNKFFFVCGWPAVPPPFVAETFLLHWTAFALCQSRLDCIRVGVFLGSLFCCMDPFVCCFTKPRLLDYSSFIASQSQSQVVSVLWLGSSPSILYWLPWAICLSTQTFSAVSR